MPENLFFDFMREEDNKAEEKSHKLLKKTDIQNFPEDDNIKKAMERFPGLYQFAQDKLVNIVKNKVNEGQLFAIAIQYMTDNFHKIEEKNNIDSSDKASFELFRIPIKDLLIDFFQNKGVRTPKKNIPPDEGGKNKKRGYTPAAYSAMDD
jgi:hypothetical protein